MTTAGPDVNVQGRPRDAAQPGPGARVRVLIADDEALARDALREVLAAHPDVDLVAEAGDGPSALAAVARTHPDVVFLDLRMPGFGGLEVARTLADAAPVPAPAVVFVTAYDEHAVDAFELHAVDYVLKPFEPARVLTALARARARVGQATLQHVLERLESLAAPGRQPGGSARPPLPPYVERFAVTTAGRVRVVPVADVEWLAADDNYVRLHTITGGGGGLVRDSLKALEAALDPAQFARVHRSAMIRIDRLRELRAVPGGEYEAVLASGARVGVGRVYRENLMRRLR